jgi:cell division inhibitor SepF
MSALHKLKAYFGMVPTDEMDDYEDDEFDYGDRYSGEDGYEPERDRIGGRRRFADGTRGGYQPEADSVTEDFQEQVRSRRPWQPETSVRGARAADSHREPVARLRAVTETGSQVNLSKITTLHPRSYSEARTIGEQYRDGTPVIMNLTEMEEADAKRLVDFAAGLAFGLRGSIEKVTNRVFLLSPPNVDVAAEDKRRLAEGAFFNYG